jgi:hypothetical protein
MSPVGGWGARMAELRRTANFYFCRAFDAQGKALDQQQAQWELLSQLPYQEGDQPRAIETGEGHLAADCQIFGGGNIVHGRFGNVRMRNLPPRKDKDEVRRALALNPDEGLEYASHFVWRSFGHCPVDSVVDATPFGVMVMEHNHEAPRASALKRYLDLLFAPQGFVVQIEPIMVRDAWTKLAAQAEVGPFTIRATRAATAGAAARAGRVSALLGAGPSGSESFELVFKPGRRRRFATEDVLAEARAWLAEAADIGQVSAIQVALEGGQVLDLLKPNLRYRLEVAASSTSTRHVDTAAMHTELRRVLARETARLADHFGRRWVEPPGGT